MVDVTHDGDDRRTRQRLDVVRRLRLGQQRVRIVELRGLRLVPHLLDQDHRRLLVEHLVDGDHRAHLHHRLDELGGLHRHLVREVGERDRLGHLDLADLRARGLRDLVAFLVAVAMTDLRLAPSRSRAAPAVSPPRSLSARLRAASSENTDPGDFFVVVRFSPGFAAGRCSVPSFAPGAFAGASLAFASAAFARASASAAAFAAASSASLRERRCDSRSCFACDVGLLARDQLLRAAASFSRATRSFSVSTEAGADGVPPAPPATRRFGGDRLDHRLGLDDAPARAATISGSGAIDLGSGAATDRRGRLVLAPDQHALLAHLDLDRARLAARVGGPDLGRLLARQRDALLRLGQRAVLLAQVVEQARLVLLGQPVADVLAAHAGRGELLDERARRHLELGRELFDRHLRHTASLALLVVSDDSRRTTRRSLPSAVAAGPSQATACSIR